MAEVRRTPRRPSQETPARGFASPKGHPIPGIAFVQNYRFPQFLYTLPPISCIKSAGWANEGRPQAAEFKAGAKVA